MAVAKSSLCRSEGACSSRPKSLLVVTETLRFAHIVPMSFGRATLPTFVKRLCYSHRVEEGEKLTAKKRRARRFFKTFAAFVSSRFKNKRRRSPTTPPYYLTTDHPCTGAGTTKSHPTSCQPSQTLPGPDPGHRGRARRRSSRGCGPCPWTRSGSRWTWRTRPRRTARG